MTRYLTIAALLGCLGLGSTLWWVSRQRDALASTAARQKRELDAVQQRLDQAAQAVAIQRNYINRIEAQAAKAQAAEAEAQNMEGADAPLPDYLRAILDRLQ